MVTVVAIVTVAVLVSAAPHLDSTEVFFIS